MRKFKVDDIIKHNEYTSQKSYKVIDIIFGEKEYKDNGFCGQTVKDCYILCSSVYYNCSYLPFYKEHLYFIVENSTTDVKSISLSCPQCNGELKDHYSDWAKANIKKCSNCGWC